MEKDGPDKNPHSFSFSAAETTSPIVRGTIDPSDRKSWKTHLTPELEQHFENMGEATVQFDVTNHRYMDPRKRFAAHYWLRKKRKNRGYRKAAITIASLIVAALGLAVAKGWL